MKYTINAGIFIDFNLSKVPVPDAIDATTLTVEVVTVFSDKSVIAFDGIVTVESVSYANPL